MSDKIDYRQMLEEALSLTGVISGCYRLFHQYSINNIFLLCAQFARRGQEPAPVATMKKWNELGRRVKKGSSAFHMWMPSTRKIRLDELDENGNEQCKIIPLFFRKRLWFSVNDTEGADVELKLETPEFSLSRILDTLSIKRVEYASVDGNSQGYCEFDTGNIAINPVAANPDKTAIHEIAHSLLHCGENRVGDKVHDDYGIHECEAESVALLTGSVLGILSENERNESIGYIRHWMESVDGLDVQKLIEKSAERIFKTVDRILKANSIQQEVPTVS